MGTRIGVLVGTACEHVQTEPVFLADVLRRGDDPTSHIRIADQVRFASAPMTLSAASTMP